MHANDRWLHDHWMTPVPNEMAQWPSPRFLPHKARRELIRSICENGRFYEDHPHWGELTGGRVLEFADLEDVCLDPGLQCVEADPFFRPQMRAHFYVATGISEELPIKIVFYFRKSPVTHELFLLIHTAYFDVPFEDKY